jgi:endonuclease/exonuclease/phosphatase family metal-dependent hydrolase
MRQGIRLILTVLLIGMLAGAALARAQEKRTQPVTVASFNIFHGIDCAVARQDPTQCRLDDRLTLLFEHLAAIGCPDIVTLQEVLGRTSVVVLTPEGQPLMLEVVSALHLITDKLPSLTEMCGFAYTPLYAADLIDPQRGPLFQGTDEELILSRYPILKQEVRLLHSALFVPGPQNRAQQFFARHVLFARIDHPVGQLDVFTTHLAASEDFGDNTCDSRVSFPAAGMMFEVPCPAACDRSQTVRECQARQVVNFVKKRHHGPAPAFIMGDFNATPDTAVYQEFINADPDHPWVDSHLQALNPECDPGTGIGCTAGRVAVRGDLERPEPNVDERIDYIFVVPPAPDSACAQSSLFDSAPSPLPGTGLFADEPNPACLLNTVATAVPVCWASDHNGTRAQVSCARSADRDGHPAVGTGPFARSTGMPVAHE